MTVEDARDLRDPQKLGQKLLELRHQIPQRSGTPLSKAYDLAAKWLGGDYITNYPQDELLSTVTAREYRRELETRAAEGDKYAQSVLDTGKPLD